MIQVWKTCRWQWTEVMINNQLEMVNTEQEEKIFPWWTLTPRIIEDGSRLRRTITLAAACLKVVASTMSFLEWLEYNCERWSSGHLKYLFAQDARNTPRCTTDAWLIPSGASFLYLHGVVSTSRIVLMLACLTQRWMLCWIGLCKHVLNDTSEERRALDFITDVVCLWTTADPTRGVR